MSNDSNMRTHFNAKKRLKGNATERLDLQIKLAVRRTTELTNVPLFSFSLFRLSSIALSSF